MLLRVTSYLALSLFLITLSGATDIAEQQRAKKQANIEGFRSAKFGSKEKNVLKAIIKDFKISKRKVKRSVHPLTRTTSLEIKVPKLLEVGGPAKIFYIFGYKSKRLMSVNILWGTGVDEKVDPQTVVDAANLLRMHLIKKQYEKEGFLANTRLDDVSTIVFRGKDKKNRLALLVLTGSKAKKDKDAQKVVSNFSLKLSYVLNAENPDIFTIKDDDF